MYASFAAWLFSAFLATLGKQRLNQYDSVDMRGHATERSQNLQNKLNGIVVLRTCTEIITIDATDRPVVARLYPLPVHLGYQHSNHIRCSWQHLIRRRFLPFHRGSGNSFCEMSISNAWIPHPSLSRPNNPSYWTLLHQCLVSVNTPRLGSVKSSPSPFANSYYH